MNGLFFDLSQTVKLSLTAAFEVFSSQNSSSSGKFLDEKKRGKMVPRRLIEMTFVLKHSAFESYNKL
jgi:hypothetical protein